MTTIIASGISKILTVARQSGLGTIATTGSGKNKRRVQSTLDLNKATYQSKEIRPSQQRSDFRHGVRNVAGTISGELSVGGYQEFMESICRQVVQTTITSGALTDIVAASTGSNTATFTTTAGDFLTGNKFKIGMVIRASGFTTTAVNNNAINMVITGVTTKVLTCATLNGAALVSKTETGAVTFLEVGKHTYVPQTGQTRDYYTIEHWFADIAQSEVFTDCVVTQMDVKLPASGMANVDFQMKGLNMQTSASEYFVSPAAVPTGGVLASANGVLYLQGVPVALVTSLNFSAKGGHTTVGGVVGSNVEPDIFPGDFVADGQLTVLFIDNVARDYFVNETEVSLFCVFTADNTATSAFTGFTFGRVKVGGAKKDDGEKGLVMTMPFTALENINAGNSTTGFATTLSIQDSAFA